MSMGRSSFQVRLRSWSCLDEVTRLKNPKARHGGFSAGKSVLGQCRRGAPFLWCDLEGGIQAFAHIDISKRVQRAPLQNAQLYATELFVLGGTTITRMEGLLGQRLIGSLVLNVTRIVEF